VTRRSKDALLDYCRSLPGVTEDVKWEHHLVFSVGGRMFALFDVFDAEEVTLKVDPAVFPILTRQPGIAPAPYLAKQSWIQLEHTRVLPRAALRELLRESHELVAAKLSRRRREALGVGSGQAVTRRDRAQSSSASSPASVPSGQIPPSAR
jgi:predicted DNA-binding protein (MmcQ/YjbR family)